VPRRLDRRARFPLRLHGFSPTGPPDNRQNITAPAGVGHTVVRIAHTASIYYVVYSTTIIKIRRHRIVAPVRINSPIRAGRPGKTATGASTPRISPAAAPAGAACGREHRNLYDP
jgi:hypothetical protein